MPSKIIIKIGDIRVPAGGASRTCWVGSGEYVEMSPTSVWSQAHIIADNLDNKTAPRQAPN